jgi:hypothetical protein
MLYDAKTMTEKADIPKWLFHYTKRETALEYILTTGRIKLSLFADTNDPVEVKTWGFPIRGVSENKTDGIFDLSAIEDEANRIRTQEWKLLCLTMDGPGYKEPEPGMLFTGHFHRGFCRSRMWAHYADRHTGVCLVFDGNKLDQSIKEVLSATSTIFSGPVRYQDHWDKESLAEIGAFFLSYREIESPNVLTGLRSHFLRNYEELFLRKSRDWETEFEYRWLVHNTAPGPEYVPISASLRSVIVGVDFPKVYEPSLIELCKNLNTSAGRMYWTGRVPGGSSDNIYKPSST